MDSRFFTLTVLMIILVNTESALDTTDFDQQIRNLANNILGVNNYQSYLDSSVNYVPSPNSQSDFLQQLTNDLQRKINNRVEAVQKMASTLTTAFGSFDQNTEFTDCCGCCSNSPDSLRFKGPVDLSTMCHTGEGTATGTSQKYPKQPLLDVMIQNLNDNPDLKWQYFGGEDGVMTIYPANKACDRKFDPRYRAWYGHSAFSTPKDIVVVVDRSGSMTEFHNNRQLMEIAKEAATTVIDTLNPDDRIGVVFFSTNAESKSDSCHGTQLAFATPENKATLKDYVNSKFASGQTYYDRAFLKAFNMLEATTNKPRYDNRNRFKLILFLTDGKPTNTEHKVVIPRENAKLDNSVIILTFGFGSGIGSSESTTLTNIATQTFDGSQAADITVLIPHAQNMKHIHKI